MDDSIEKIVAEMRRASVSSVPDELATFERLNDWADRLDYLRQAPEGYVLVPREPDGRMWIIGRAEFVRKAQDYEDARSAEKASLIADVSGSDIYRAMIAAATKANPDPPTSGECKHDVCCLAKSTGITCADDECDIASGVRAEATPAQAGAELPERPFRLEVGANGKPTGYFIFDFDESLALLSRARLALKEGECDLHYHDEHGVRRSLVERIDAYLAKGCRNG